MIVSRPPRIRATVSVPTDKSISHRSFIFNAIADGRARIESPLDSADVRSTVRCLRALGAEIDWPEGAAEATVRGHGMHGLFEAEDVLDCGNSGTTMRLLSGLLAAHPLLSILSGDASLRTRPMARVLGPLRAMGAHVQGRRGDTLPPLVIRGGDLTGIDFRSPVASAQVKSALLLAGLYAAGETSILEPSRSRDHTERMLLAMGAAIEEREGKIGITAASRLEPLSLRVPGDISSAAPWLVLGACHPDAEILITGVNTNPTRTGLLDILAAMGATVERLEERSAGGEPIADLLVRTSQLKATTVSGGVVPRAIDELPLVAVLACFAEGATVVRDAAELRAKESDRVEAVVRTLGRMGVKVQARDDGFVIDGPVKELRGARVDAGGDHRIGMLAGVLGALAEGETHVDNGAVEVSYPAFWSDLSRVDAVSGMRKPVLVILHGPAGVGKDSVIAALQERTGIRRATSATSRPPRNGERDGVDYWFFSAGEFEEKIARGEFAEWADVYGEYKGVERSEIAGPLERGEDVIIRTDVQGARTWRKRIPGAVSIFLMAEDREALRARLIDRGSETDESLARRLGELEEELSDIPHNDYVIYNRHNALADTVDEIAAIIERERDDPARPAPLLAD